MRARGCSHCDIPSQTPLLFSHSVVSDLATPWTVARQASLPFTISLSLLKLMSIESVMPSNHLILCHPVPLPSIFPSISIFSNELAHHIRLLEFALLEVSVRTLGLDFQKLLFPEI